MLIFCFGIFKCSGNCTCSLNIWNNPMFVDSHHKIWDIYFTIAIKYGYDFLATCSSSSMYEMFVSKVQLSFYDCLSFEIFSPTDCSASKNAALDDYQTWENIKCFSLDMHSDTLVGTSFLWDLCSSLPSSIQKSLP